MKKLRIAMTSRSATLHEERVFFDFTSYFDYVHHASHIPMMVHVESQEEAQAIAEVCDGLIVTGGEDINPALYNRENTHSEPIDQDVEDSDIYLYKAFINANKPVLGICRGMQLIAAIEGGSLTQDILKENASTMDHDQKGKKEKDETYHKCDVVKDTRLYGMFGDVVDVNSYHHQVVKEAPASFTVSAYSQDDQLIEAMEKDQVLCVQWHPERLYKSHPEHQKILQAFLEDCLLCQTK